MTTESLPKLTKAPIPVQTHTLKIEDRLAKGKALRNVISRKSQKEWTPPIKRPDPIDLLIESSQGRVEELLPIRYGRMMVSPFTFFRGAASIMASDLSCTPSTGLTLVAGIGANAMIPGRQPSVVMELPPLRLPAARKQQILRQVSRRRKQPSGQEPMPVEEHMGQDPRLLEIQSGNPGETRGPISHASLERLEVTDLAGVTADRLDLTLHDVLGLTCFSLRLGLAERQQRPAVTGLDLPLGDELLIGACCLLHASGHEVRGSSGPDDPLLGVTQVGRSFHERAEGPVGGIVTSDRQLRHAHQ